MIDELAQRRQERDGGGEEQNLRDRVRDETRRSARRHAAAARARLRAGSAADGGPHPFDGGDDAGAA